MVSLVGLVSLAALISFVGGLLPVWRKPDDRVRSYLLHFAAGVLLAVVTAEIWPEIEDLDRPAWMIAGLVLGAVAMIAVNALTERLEARETDGPDLPTGMLAAGGVDSVVDGALIGIGYASDPSLGILLAVGLGFEKFTTTMTVCAEMREQGHPRRRVILCALAMTATMVPSALLGYALLADASDSLQTAMLAVAASALVYFVTIELVTRGRNTHATPWTVLCFFAGFVALTSFEVFTPV